MKFRLSVWECRPNSEARWGYRVERKTRFGWKSVMLGWADNEGVARAKAEGEARRYRPRASYQYEYEVEK